jgi:hypothetical protein
VLLGGAFLRAYRLTLDAPGRRVALEPYPTLPHVDPDEWVSVGFRWQESSPGVVTVSLVYARTDAETVGVAVGDRLLRAGDRDVVALGASTVDDLVAGAAPGEVLPFLFGRGDATALRSVLVEDLLPAFE